MSTSNFNAEAFMSTEVEVVGELDYTPIPEDEYDAVIKELKADVTNNGNPFMEVHWIIDDEGVRKLLDNPEPTCRQSLWLDIDDDGLLESGPNKNIQLFRLRDALGQNDGKPWAPPMMIGQVAKVQVKHRLDNTGKPFAEVKGVRA